MFLQLFIISVIYVWPFSKGHLTLSEEDYKLLPPIYEMSDYKRCVEIKGRYCKADIRLAPLDRNNKIWKLIEESQKDNFLFNHDEIYRTVCVPIIYENSSKTYISNIVNKQIKQKNLTSTIEKVSCKEDYKSTSLDNFLMKTLLTYVYFIVAVTIYDIMIRRKDMSAKDNALTAFSLRHNFKKIFDVSRSRHYQNLKSIQGLRTVSCALVIMTHVKILYVTLFIQDTKYVEDIYNVLYYICIFDFFLTQIFSLISAWLLTVQIYSIFEANNEFTIKDSFIITINRICRLWPPMLFVVAFYRKATVGIIVDDTLTVGFDTANACEKNWLYSLLFIQNIFSAGNMCNVAYWYISADFQLYIVCLLVLYLILKFQRHTKLILGTSLLLSYGIFSCVIYFNNMDIIFRPYPETLKWNKFLNDTNLIYLYEMSYVSMGTYIVGICFGIFYYRHHQLKDNKIPQIIWTLSFCMLPLLAVAIASREFSGLSGALVGPLLKPLFSFGIGMGILGMSQNTNGIIKRVFEWRPLEFLSQFTYCAYVYHMLILFSKAGMYEPLKVSSYILIKSCIVETFKGFISGFAGYLLVELPWRNIQTMFLPQIKKKSPKATEKVN